MILTAISDRLGLSSVHNTSAYSVLRNYGNSQTSTDTDCTRGTCLGGACAHSFLCLLLICSLA